MRQFAELHGDVVIEGQRGAHLKWCAFEDIVMLRLWYVKMRPVADADPISRPPPRLLTAPRDAGTVQCDFSKCQGACAILKGIDHLVIVVPELEAAIASYRGLGFTVVPGGRHPIGTHNALIAFGDGSYLELIAFFEPNAQHRWYQRLQQGGGLIDICLQTDDLAGDVRAFRDAGVAIADPRPLSRVRPDGYELRWVLSIPEMHAGVAPFLIEDETPRDERVPRATAHGNGATGIRLVTVAVSDVPTVRRWYGRARGASVAPVEREDLAASGARVTMGSHALDFVTPRNAESPLAGWLATRGSSPYAASLATSGTPGPLPADRTLGARLSLG